MLLNSLAVKFAGVNVIAASCANVTVPVPAAQLVLSVLAFVQLPRNLFVVPDPHLIHEAELMSTHPPDPVPVKIDGTKSCVNFWSTEDTAFPKEAEAFLVEVAKLVK